MKFLADSNVFIDFWHGKNLKQYTWIFTNHDVVLCGVVVAELIQGAYSDKNKQRIQETLSLFEQVNLEDWETFGQQLYALRKHGVTVPFQDAMIASIALKYNLPVWTNDKHFVRMQKAMPELQLVTEEELCIGCYEV